MTLFIAGLLVGTVLGVCIPLARTKYTKYRTAQFWRHHAEAEKLRDAWQAAHPFGLGYEDRQR